MTKSELSEKYDRYFGIEPNDDELTFYYNQIQEVSKERRLMENDAYNSGFADGIIEVTGKAPPKLPL